MLSVQGFGWQIIEDGEDLLDGFIDRVVRCRTFAARICLR